MIEIAIFWFQIHITNGLNSLHWKWRTGNQYRVTAAENRMRSQASTLTFVRYHWYKRALFDLQFVHKLFWLKLKWNARSKLFCCIIYCSTMIWWSSRTSTKFKSQSQKRFKERKYQYLKYKNKNPSGTDT